MLDLFFCICRGIKLPSLEKAVNIRKKTLEATQRGKKGRGGRGRSGRGRGTTRTTRGTLREIKENIASKKEEDVDPLSSDPVTIDDTEDEDIVKPEVVKKEKEDEPQVKIRNQTARRGKPFGRSAPASRKLQMTSCSINLEKDCVTGSGSLDTPKKPKEHKKKVTDEENKSEKHEKGETKLKEDSSKTDNSKESGKVKTDDENKKEESDNQKVKSDMNESENKKNGEVMKDSELEGMATDAGGEGFEASTMIAYVNNSEIADDTPNVTETEKKTTDDTEKGLVVDVAETEKNTRDESEKGLVLESEADKKYRMCVIGQSLTISQLEDDLDNELKNRFDIEDTEERIRRLRSVLDLLKKQDLSKQDTQEKNTSQDKEKKDGYVKSTDDGKDGNKSQEELEEEVEKKGEVSESGTYEDEPIEDGLITKDPEIMKNEGRHETEPGIVNSDNKSAKSVRFEGLSDDDDELEGNFHISVNVGEVVKKVILMKDNDGDDKHEIDNFYVKFPSSQKNAQVIIEQLKDEDEKEKYSPKTEDITDDEEDTKDEKPVTRRTYK